MGLTAVSLVALRKLLPLSSVSSVASNSNVIAGKQSVNEGCISMWNGRREKNIINQRLKSDPNCTLSVDTMQGGDQHDFMSRL